MNKKTMVLATASLLTVATAGVVSAATHSDPQPTKTTITKTATVESTPTVTQDTTPVDTQPTQGQTVRATPVEQPVVSVADQNKAQLQQAIRDASNVTIAATNQPNAAQFIQDQLACIDKFITGSTGYGVDYNTLLTNSAYVVLLPIHNADGTTTYRHFEGLATCTVVAVTV